MKIVVLEKIEYFTDEQWKNIKSLGDVEFYDSSTEEEAKERVKNADIVMIDFVDPNPFLENMKSNSLISLMSTGYSWVDIKKARAYEIFISNIPDSFTESVAEHVIGLIFAVSRKIALGDRNIRNENKSQVDYQGIELKDRILGVVGLGRIGSRVAEIGSAIGMNVIAFDKNIKNNRNKEIKEVDLDTLLKEADIVSLNCDLNDTSRGMLSKEKLDLLKEKSILVSATSGLFDSKALLRKLQNKEILGAGFDVALESGNEDVTKDYAELDNVVLTPHIAFNTEEAIIRQTEICIVNLEKFIEGKPQNIVN